MPFKLLMVLVPLFIALVGPFVTYDESGLLSTVAWVTAVVAAPVIAFIGYIVTLIAKETSHPTRYSLLGFGVPSLLVSLYVLRFFMF